MSEHTTNNQNAATTKSARVVNSSPPVRDVVVVELADGTTMRVTLAVLRDVVTRPFRARFITYDIDAAGNRYNARPAREDAFLPAGPPVTDPKHTRAGR